MLTAAMKLKETYLWKESYDQPQQHIKKQRHYFANKVHLVKAMQVRKQQLELDMEQQTGSKSGKEYVKAGWCHPAYLTYMQSTL